MPRLLMLDSDLAEIYGYETKNFNRQVKNNIEKFPDDMMFKLTPEETTYISRCKKCTSIMQTSGVKGGRTYLSYAFTEQGIYMLMTVLKGDLATKQSIALVRLFKQMKDTVSENLLFFQRLDRIELKQLESDEEFRLIFEQLEQPRQHKAVVFFKGQMWDALSCIEEIISKACELLILIDGYVNKDTLDILSKKRKGIPVVIYTYEKTCSITEKEIKEFCNQYGEVTIKFSDEFHDRFLILDNKLFYHIGASIKDAGKKGFEISICEDELILQSLLERLA